MCDLTNHQKRKKRKGLCVIPYCRNRRRDNRSHCHSCAKSAWRKRNPLMAAYSSLKNNALRRGKYFDLTFAEFKKFAIKVDLLGKRGISKHSYHIDRIDEEGGYTADNIQLIKNHENVKKYYNYKRFHTVKENIDTRQDLPF